MRAVLIEVNVSGVDRDAGLRGIREQLVPAISQMPGFRSGTWADRKTLTDSACR